MIALTKKTKLEWTNQDLAFLRSPEGRELVRQRMYPDIAKILGRSRIAVAAKVRRIYGEELQALHKDPKEPAVPSPTPALPGSPQKIAVLRQRLARNEQLFHEYDGPAFIGPLPAKHDGWLP
jgi:hypothetical protein